MFAGCSHREDEPAPPQVEAPPPPPTSRAPIAVADVPEGFFPAVRVEVQSVVDGDTAHFVFPDGEHKVRFLWVDTEESRGERATGFGRSTERRARLAIEAARRVDVAVRRKAGAPDQDAFGRWLGLVFVDGALYETRLVREGLSLYYTKFGCAPSPLHAALLAAEAEARTARRGVWAEGHPTDYGPIVAGWNARHPCRPDPFR